MRSMKDKLPGWAAAVTFAFGMAGDTHAVPEAKIEVFDPYETWLEGERWGVYLRVTNTGDEPFTLLSQPDLKQLFLEPTFGEPSTPLSRFILETPLPSVQEAEWREVETAAAADGSVTVKPGEQFVFGPESVNQIEGLHALMHRRMSGYQFHLLLAEGVWASSPATMRRFVIDEDAWDNEPIAQIPLSIEGLNAPVREITIAGETWLFEGNMRLCRVPDGHRPEFSFDEGTRDFLNISFEGINNGSIRVDNKMGYPISGPPALVPQLALWQRLTGRPMGWATAGTRAERAEDFQDPGGDEEVMDQGKADLAGPEPHAPGPEPQATPEGASTEAELWPWLAVSACLLLGALWMIARR